MNSAWQTFSTLDENELAKLEELPHQHCASKAIMTWIADRHGRDIDLDASAKAQGSTMEIMGQLLALEDEIQRLTKDNYEDDDDIDRSPREKQSMSIENKLCEMRTRISDFRKQELCRRRIDDLYNQSMTGWMYPRARDGCRNPTLEWTASNHHIVSRL